MTREWCAEQSLIKVVSKISTDQTPAQRAYHHYNDGEHIPVSAWEDALLKTIDIVNELGEEYIGLFERAERELEKAKDQMTTIQRMQKISRNRPVITLETLAENTL